MIIKTNSEMRKLLPFKIQKKRPLKVSVDNVAHYDNNNETRRKDYASIEQKIRNHFYLGLDDQEYHKYYDDKYH